jgi:hypothetical protein
MLRDGKGALVMYLVNWNPPHMVACPDHLQDHIDNIHYQ